MFIIKVWRRTPYEICFREGKRRWSVSRAKKMFPNIKMIQKQRMEKCWGPVVEYTSIYLMHALGGSLYQ
jgi:hypothetical protein